MRTWKLNIPSCFYSQRWHQKLLEKGFTLNPHFLPDTGYCWAVGKQLWSPLPLDLRKTLSIPWFAKSFKEHKDGPDTKCVLGRGIRAKNRSHCMWSVCCKWLSQPDGERHLLVRRWQSHNRTIRILWEVPPHGALKTGPWSEMDGE